VLVYSGTLSQETLFAGLQANPHGFVHKEDTLETLREGLKAVSAGNEFYSPAASRVRELIRKHPMGQPELSDRERSVLKGIASGKTAKEIADEIGLSRRTVEHYRAALAEKLGTSEPALLTRIALKRGLVSVDE
jgi:DNA-binding NarL/FixJ family response regulator